MRRKFFKAAGLNFFLLQIVFLSLFCWILGVLWQLTTHVHNLNIVFVDFDGGAIGSAIRAAYKNLASDGFPELVEQSPSDLASSADVYNSVCHADYWAALCVSSGASARLHTALTTSGGPQGYNGADALSYVWNEAKYPAFMDSLVSGSIQTLSNAAREIYTAGIISNVTLSDLNVTGPDALAVLAKPWTLSSINIQPTTQGARFIYNTILILLIMIENFFYLVCNCVSADATDPSLTTAFPGHDQWSLPQYGAVGKGEAAFPAPAARPQRPYLYLHRIPVHSGRHLGLQVWLGRERRTVRGNVDASMA
jgi:hypothetical protein